MNRFGTAKKKVFPFYRIYSWKWFLKIWIWNSILKYVKICRVMGLRPITGLKTGKETLNALKRWAEVDENHSLIGMSGVTTIGTRLVGSGTTCTGTSKPTTAGLVVLWPTGTTVTWWKIVKWKDKYTYNIVVFKTRIYQQNHERFS